MAEGLKQKGIKQTGKRQGCCVYIFKWTTIFWEHKKLPSSQRCNQVAVNLPLLKTHKCLVTPTIQPAQQVWNEG